MSTAEKLKAQLVIVTGLILLYFLFKKIGFLYAATIIGVLCLMSTYIGDLIVKGWYKIAEILGWINTRILLSIVFYCFLFPIAFINRLFSKGSLALKNPAGSIYETRDHKYKKEDLENTW